VTTDIAAALTESRDRLLDLLAPLDDDALTRQHSPLMSPLAWDLAHIGNYEDIWLVRALGADGVGPELDHLYDAFQHPRATRPSLPLLSPDEARAYVSKVRDRALDLLADADTSPGNTNPLLAGGFVYGMVVQHEHQHIETILATLQLGGLLDPPALAVCSASGEAVVPDGTHEIGTSAQAWAYDNERPAHAVELAAFAIDRAPVTNAQWQAFLDDDGWPEPPLLWDAGRQRDPGAPVIHVSWHEADSFARWCGRRLPTEHEWEAAARLGVLEGLGQVWEWTASDFQPWPGFRAFPYPEYSEVFWGRDHKVLRGSSWASHASVQRPTFRNWDYPIRRQIFAGVRTARDVA
jgi:iron(II)-dependent oxidoreductase